MLPTQIDENLQKINMYKINTTGPVSWVWGGGGIHKIITSGPISWPVMGGAENMNKLTLQSPSPGHGWA
jgi:hypothetical protein